MKRIALIVSILVFGLFACKNGKREIQVLLTDAPGDYEEVNIEIREVKVNFNKDADGWLALNPAPGIYDLLEFQNGVTTPIANGTVPDGTVKELRLVLGPDNTVKVDGVYYPLVLSSQGESGLKIKVDTKLEKDLNTITIDFDAAQSVVKEQNGVYRLHPVIILK